ncbi:cell wall hydrolase [Amorphus sp. 3PC139-8]
MLAQQAGPRYLARIVNAPYGETIAPTFAYGTAVGEVESRSSKVAMAGLDGFEALGLADANVVAPDKATVTTLSVRSETASKGDRLATIRPDSGNADIGAGSVATAVSLLTPGTIKDFPRVAFVRPEGFEGAPGAKSLLAAGGIEPNESAQAATARFLAATTAATSASLASAYASEGGIDLNAPFEALLGQGAGTAKTAGPLDHWWSDRPLPEDITDARQIKCLAEAVYFEARSESRLGQMAVAQVVINRVKNPAYPDTICGVVYQNKGWFNRCQFSFACDRVRDVVNDRPAWTQAMEIANGYTKQTMWLPSIGASTHYHATYVSPKWAPHMKRLERIGHHVFYLTFGGDWT